MKSNLSLAMQLWRSKYGTREFARDFHGNLMYRDAYGKRDYFIIKNGVRIYCGWNLHHILPKSLGGTNRINNLLCTNFLTNKTAGAKITFWIENCLYQVQKDKNAYRIVSLN